MSARLTGAQRAPKLTQGQKNLLRKLADEPGAALVVVMIDDGGYNGQPIFRGWLYHAPCQTCQHSRKDRADWRGIHQPSELGLIAENLKGTGWYSAITDAGRQALAHPDAGGDHDRP